MSNWKKIVSVLLALGMMMALLTACSQDTESTSEETTAAESGETMKVEDITVYNKQENPETVILVVSFGTSFNDSRVKTIGGIESAIAKAFPNVEVRRAFTSQIIIDKLAERDGVEIDNVTQALDKLVADGVKNLVVQPTHLMNGFEYTDLQEDLEKYSNNFKSIKIGNPLLTSDADYEAVIKAITEDMKDYDDGSTAIAFMGHGTEADSNGVYAKLQEKITAAGYKNFVIGTVEATPSIDDVVKFAKDGGYKRVVLHPLMVVAGDHANNDMAGDEEDSWKSILEKEGFEVVPVLEGLGQNEAIQQIYVSHVSALLAE